MISKIREDLLSAGCTDEKMIQQLESEWGKLDACNPRSALAKMVVTCGRDLGKLSKYLASALGLDQRAAGKIALSFANKASSQLGKENQRKLGITMGVWSAASWSGSPCNHAALQGKYFSLKTGAKFNGRRIFPGQDGDCRCHYAPYIKGFLDGPPPERLLDKMKRLLGLNQN